MERYFENKVNGQIANISSPKLWSDYLPQYDEQGKELPCEWVELTYEKWKLKTEPSQKDIDKQAKLDKITDLKSKLANTDYQAIKYAEGQMSESEYIPIKVQRQAWRNEINELEAQLNNI